MIEPFQNALKTLTMFGIEMATFSFWAVAAETGILLYQLGVYRSRKRDIATIRFLTLLSVFIGYNLINGILQQLNLAIAPLIEALIWSCSSFILFTAYFYYLFKELNLSGQKLFNAKSLFFFVTILVFSAFGLVFYFSRDFSFSAHIALLPLALTAVYYCFRIVRLLLLSQPMYLKKSRPYKYLLIVSLSGSALMIALPLTSFTVYSQILDSLFVNASFFLAFFAYLNYQSYQHKIEHEVLSNLEEHPDLSMEQRLRYSLTFWNTALTKRERDIAFLILRGTSYKEISDMLYIEQKTVSKHASNIRKKLNCKDQDEFLSKFTGLENLEGLDLKPTKN